MDTKTEIIRIGDCLIREKGYNAFSFSDIAKQLGIKNASVHYHFPTKKALAVAVVQQHRGQLKQLNRKTANQEPLKKLRAFLRIYSTAKSENKICIVGSLATDLNTVAPEIHQALQAMANDLLNWVIEILREGRTKSVFHFSTDERTKALMIITNMLAAVQLIRLTGEEDFNTIEKTIIQELQRA